MGEAVRVALSRMQEGEIIVPVVICLSHPCASAWHLVQLTEGPTPRFHKSRQLTAHSGTRNIWQLMHDSMYGTAKLIVPQVLRSPRRTW